MSVEVGQDISSILGSGGSYIGNPNTMMAQGLISGLGLSAEPGATMAGAFNGSSLGVEKKPTASTAAKAAPAIEAKFTV